MPKAQSGRQRARPQDLDRHLGGRLQQRRTLLGLNQQQLADLIGVTYQQVNKYEKGINRISAGRLYVIAKVLDVEIGFFFQGLQDDQQFEAVPHAPLLLDLVRNFLSLTDTHHQTALSALVRALADPTTGNSSIADTKPDPDPSAT